MSSIFPFINTTPVTDQTLVQKLPVFHEYAYDPEHNRLALGEDGLPYMVEENEALRIWIYKALSTERFHYVAYDTDYGSETDTLIGKNYNTDITNSELKRMIVEALMCNPYIEELSNWEFEAERNRIRVSFDVTTIYGTDRFEKGVDI
ncbi:DUF2634 domain-containing protein [Lachnospiraceae bacterium 54-53]